MNYTVNPSLGKGAFLPPVCFLLIARNSKSCEPGTLEH